MAIDYNIEEEIRESLDKSLKQFPKRKLPLGGARPAGEVAKERGVLGGGERAMGGARPAGDVAQERSILGGKKEVEIIERPEKVELKTPAEILFDTKIAEATEALEQKFAEALVNLSRDFTTVYDVESLIRNKIPIAIRHLDSIPPSGNVLKLVTGGVGHWGSITEGEGGITHDYVYVGDKKLTVPTRTTNFLKVYLDGRTAPEWVAAMPETQASDSEVFDVTKNRIQLPGNFAGG